MGVEKGGRNDRWEEEGEGGKAIGKFKYEIICNNFSQLFYGSSHPRK